MMNKNNVVQIKNSQQNLLRDISNMAIINVDESYKQNLKSKNRLIEQGKVETVKLQRDVETLQKDNTEIKHLLQHILKAITN